ncbi:hypothetical protein Lal_00000328, partial [Lupinus albus]
SWDKEYEVARAEERIWKLKEENDKHIDKVIISAEKIRKLKEENDTFIRSQTNYFTDDANYSTKPPEFTSLSIQTNNFNLSGTQLAGTIVVN